MILFFISVCREVHLAGGVFLFEHPADPGRHPYASIWDTEELKHMVDLTGALLVVTDQCPYGCQARKRTTLCGTIEDMQGFQRWCPGVSPWHVHAPTSGKSRGGEWNTHILQEYPPELNEAIAERFVRSFTLMRDLGSGPGGATRPKASQPHVTAWSSWEPQGRGLAVLNETHLKGQHVVLEPGVVASYLHVDDNILISTSRTMSEARVGGKKVKNKPLCDHCVHEAAQALRDVGFVVKDVRESGESKKLVGYRPTLSPPTLRPPSDKLAYLWEGFGYLLSKQSVDVDLLHGLVGVWIWVALLRRDALSAASGVFKFINVHTGRTTARWWPSVWKEVRVMRALTPLLVVEADRPVAPVLMASDAQGAFEVDDGGFGAVCGDCSLSEARGLLMKGAPPGRTVVRLDVEDQRLRWNPERLQLSVPVSRVPRSLLQRIHWQPVARGRWRWADHITLGEGRAALRLLLIVAGMPSAHHHLLLSLEDNTSLAGAWAKGRSPSRALNYLLRRRAGTCLAARITMMLPWVQSADMPADELSRTL